MDADGHGSEKEISQANVFTNKRGFSFAEETFGPRLNPCFSVSIRGLIEWIRLKVDVCDVALKFLRPAKCP